MKDNMLIEFCQVDKAFRGKNKKNPILALQQVTLSIFEQEILAIIGESGSGKSTMAELIVGLQKPTKGVVKRDKRLARCGSVQMVFQNPDRSLNPYWRMDQIIAEPMRLAGVHGQEIKQKTKDLMEQVQLPLSLLEKKTSECSGGQKQRVAIARALSLRPQLLIADEITSALDPSTEQAILELLESLRKQHEMTIVYITHRLDTIVDFADRVAVMKDGLLIEAGKTEHILHMPVEPYTKAMLDAVRFA